MIVVRLIGGLGNQMFQYALGRHLAYKNQVQLKLDLHYLLDRRPRPNMVFRDFDLPIFKIKDIDDAVATKKEVAKFIGGYNSVWQAWKHRVRIRLHPPNIVREISTSFNPSILDQPDETYLWGFWQSEKYFKSIEAIIREEFQFKHQLNERSYKLADYIKSCNAVCINVRRTDFVDNPESSKILGFTGLDYIYRAVHFILTKVEKPVFFVFSDDIEWCKKSIILEHKVQFIDHSYAGEKFQNYLHLMTFCKHYIIPNSTFAWWAAWLNNTSGKIVIVPKKWFADPLQNNRDLIPDHWLKI